jgi:hypothetical protein
VSSGFQPFQNSSPASPPQPGEGGALRYWGGIDPAIAQVFEVMDRQDEWSIEDHETVRVSLDRLIARLEKSPKLGTFCLREPAKSMELMSWLKSSSALMLLHYSHEDRRNVVELFLEVCASVLKNPESSDEHYRQASLALDRFLVFERLAMLNRLFSPERTEKVERAIDDAMAMVTPTDKFAERG